MKTTTIFSVLILIIYSNCGYCQEWHLLGNGGTNPATDFVGTNDANPLNLKTTFTTTPQPINFFTNNTFRMTIGANGLVGIGNNLGSYTLLQVLDVEGTMNLNTATLYAHGYRINDIVILTNPGIGNTFVG
jgi:hypothetical protein